MDAISKERTYANEKARLAREEALLEGREKGIEEGRAEGAKHEQVKMVLLMKQAGEAVDKISLYTGLTPDEINQIISSKD